MHLDSIKTQVERIKGVVPSVVAMLKSLSDQVAAAKDDPEEIQGIADDMKTQADALAAAINANP